MTRWQGMGENIDESPSRTPAIFGPSTPNFVSSQKSRPWLVEVVDMIMPSFHSLHSILLACMEG